MVTLYVTKVQIKMRDIKSYDNSMQLMVYEPQVIHNSDWCGVTLTDLSTVVYSVMSLRHIFNYSHVYMCFIY